jgi:hypothetical protein
MQLNTYGSVTLNASGTGQVTLNPTAMMDWRVTRMAVKTTQAPNQTPIPTCTVYLGNVSDGDIVDQTWTGSRDVSDCDIAVPYGTPLIFRWEGGVAGTTATASILGTQALRS